jgi:hypothetical protein
MVIQLDANYRPVAVIPANAGIQQRLNKALDSGFRCAAPE